MLGTIESMISDEPRSTQKTKIGQGKGTLSLKVLFVVVIAYEYKHDMSNMITSCYYEHALYDMLELLAFIIECMQVIVVIMKRSRCGHA